MWSFCQAAQRSGYATCSSASWEVDRIGASADRGALVLAVLSLFTNDDLFHIQIAAIALSIEVMDARYNHFVVHAQIVLSE